MAKAARPSTRRKSATVRSRGSKSSARSARGRSATPRSRRSSSGRLDAIALLKGDHREAESLFEQFEKARTDDRKKELASRVCNALRVHSQIEEEIFYPAFLESARDEDLHHEAIIEHDGVKKLIAEIESSGPGDEYFDARVKVLSEMVKHHVKEEEKRDGLFAEARGSGMDLEDLGRRLAERKAQLEAEPGMLKTAKMIKDAGKGLMTRALTDL